MALSSVDGDWLKANLRVGRTDLPSRNFERKLLINEYSNTTGEKIVRGKKAPASEQPQQIVQPETIVEAQPEEPKPSLLSSFKQKYFNPKYALIGMAGFLFVIGLSVSGYGFMQNKQVKAQADTLQKKVNQGGGSSDMPSTVKPSAASVAAYTVPPNNPRYLTIPKFGVFAAVRPLGLTKDGELATPNNIYDVGWYNSSALPDQPGAMLIDGHVSSWTAHGSFYNLKNLVAGDEVKIQRGDGTIDVYKVIRSQVYNADSTDMQSAMQPVDPTKPGLNLITCTGNVIKGTNEFSERIIVYTSLES